MRVATASDSVNASATGRIATRWLGSASGNVHERAQTRHAGQTQGRRRAARGSCRYEQSSSDAGGAKRGRTRLAAAPSVRASSRQAKVDQAISSTKAPPLQTPMPVGEPTIALLGAICRSGRSDDTWFRPVLHRCVSELARVP